MKNMLFVLGIVLTLSACNQPSALRKETSLNGTWRIAKTLSFDELPTQFDSEVPVPGLVDLAVPPLDTNTLFKEGIYWHKTRFTLSEEHRGVVQLRIGKARYHSKVYLNGKFVGEEVYCFTATSYDLDGLLKPPGEENELLVAIGTKDFLPDTVIWGHDFEKLTYIPGIYDEVKLVLSGYPFIENVQIAPQPDLEHVRIVYDIDYGPEKEGTPVSYEISEVATGRKVAKGRSRNNDFTVRIPGSKPWSPESPFLYELKLLTGSDSYSTRFGMRTFTFDPVAGRAILNGKPYFMRGTNVCIFRFFEDPARGSLPWENDWALNLHSQFKSMHWNSIRYCIGFPPERWYEIADSLGFLIQDEYPVWARFENSYPNITSEHLANEYRVWMKERWNHASVVIWDAQNESVTPVTGEAIQKVRGLDLSGRPWENGWSPPQHENDPIEHHPYFFSRYRRGAVPSEKGALYDFGSTVRDPGKGGANEKSPSPDGKKYPNATIINEYPWLWLNRDGSTTTLTDQVYEVAFGKGLTREKREYIYNRYIGMITEYWRAHRMTGGVLHFCGLGYSRAEEPRGQTSDNFSDIKSLTFNPLFVEYVKPSFAPIGLMVNFWEQYLKPSESISFDVFVINDLENTWEGEVSLKLMAGENTIHLDKKTVVVQGLGRQVIEFKLSTPTEAGDYRIVAEISPDGSPVKSIRDISVKD